MTPAASVHARLIESDWDDLPRAIRRVHAQRPVVLVGRATVRRGTGWISRLGGRIAGLPSAGDRQPLSVRLEPLDGAAERWVRHFGDHPPMNSLIRAQDGALVEVLGAVHLHFGLRASPQGIAWQARSGSLWGWCPMPRSWLEGIAARELEVDGQYAFEVRVLLPWVGLVVDYRGELRIDECAAPA